MTEVAIPSFGGGVYERTFIDGNLLVDFYASADFVKKHGNTFHKGDTITVKQAEVVQTTDGYGNSGTKLILTCTSAYGSSTLYCYGLDMSRKRLWTIDKASILKILAGKFEVISPAPTPVPPRPTPVPPTPTPRPTPTPGPTPAPAPTPAPEFYGLTLTAVTEVALASLPGGDSLRIFSAGQLLVECYASADFVKKHGTTFHKGDTMTVKDAVVLPNTDGYGNSGTKLILTCTSAYGNATLYCYGLDGGAKRFWTIDKATVLKILAGNFEVNPPAPTPVPPRPTPTPPPTPAPAPKPRPEFNGLTLIAVKDVTIPSLGGGVYEQTFSAGQLLVDFYLSAAFAAKHGNTFHKGDAIIVKEASEVVNTDGYGNSGTKLILTCVWTLVRTGTHNQFEIRDNKPDGPATLYCYGLDSRAKRLWSVNKGELQRILAANFQVK